MLFRIFILSLTLFISPVFAAEEKCAADLAAPAVSAAPTLVQQQRQVLRDLVKNIDVESTNAITAAQRTILYKDQEDFIFEKNRGVVFELLNRLEQKIDAEKDDKLRTAYLNLAEEGQDLVQASATGTPYRATVTWVFAYLHLQDMVARENPPPGVTLTYFHTDYGKMRLAELLREAPDVLLVFDFGLSPLKALLSMQASPFKVVAVNEEAEFADAFWLSPAEAAYHDVGHSWLSNKRDHLVARKRGISIEELRRRGRRLNAILDQKTLALKKIDPGLADALTVYRFEIHHERGIPVDQRVLQDESNTRLRVASLEYKIATGFFGMVEIPKDLATRVEAARVWLGHELAQGEEYTESTLPDVGTKKTFAYFELAYEDHGQYVSTNIVSPEEIMVEFVTDQGQHVHSNLADISLAQIAEQPTVPPDVLERAAELDNYDRFRLKQLNTLRIEQKSVPFIVDGSLHSVEGIYLGQAIDESGRRMVRLSVDGQLRTIPYSQIVN